MQKYIQIAFTSRGLPTDGSIIPMCEWCKSAKSQDVEHIEGRGGKRNIDNRMYDPKNLMLLCRKCHQGKGGFDWKEKAKLIVLNNLTIK